ncbi:MAG: TM2 domain-containing protein [Candidatus Merdivicinus sp.]|jgi:TM2 domain-containing membrane protein YozV
MAKGKYQKRREEAQQQSKIREEKMAPVIEYQPSNENLTDLDFQRQAAQNAAGQEESTYGVWGPIWKFMKWCDSKKGHHTFKKSTYLWLMLFLGWMGGHRYYQGRRILGLLYTVFCWTGVPFILCITDFMEVFPLKADENGKVTL